MMGTPTEEVQRMRELEGVRNVRVDLPWYLDCQMEITRDFEFMKCCRQQVKLFFGETTVPLFFPLQSYGEALLNKLFRSNNRFDRTNLKIFFSCRQYENHVELRGSNFDILFALFPDDPNLRVIVSGKILNESWTTEEMTIQNDGTFTTGRFFPSHLLLDAFRVSGSTVVTNLRIEPIWDCDPYKGAKTYSFNLTTSLSMLTSTYSYEDMTGFLTFVSCTGEKIKCLRSLVLASNCLKLKTLLNSHGMMECQTGEVSLPTMSTRGIRALVNFLINFDLTEPLIDSEIAVELLIAGHYNIFPDLVQAISKIILGRPVYWLGINAGVEMYKFTKIVVESYGKKLEGEEMWNRHWTSDKWKWEKLLIRAEWNLRMFNEKELKSSELFRTLFPDEYGLNLYLEACCLKSE